MDDTRLGSLLLENPLMREEDLQRCLEIQAMTGGAKPLGQILVEEGVVSPQTLEQLLALQRERRGGVEMPIHVADRRPEPLLREAVAQGATDLLVSEGRPVCARVGGTLRALTQDPISSPETWDFVRALLGADALDQLAAGKPMRRQVQVPGVCRGRAVVFRHSEGIAINLRIQPETPRRPEESGLPGGFLHTIDEGRGLVLLIGEGRSGRSSNLATVLDHVAADPGRMVVVLDESFEWPAPRGGAVVVRRRVGVDTSDYLRGLECALREEPDVLIVGDVPSPEAFELVAHAAEGGRTVVAGMRGTSISGALRRAIQAFPPLERRRMQSALASVLRSALLVQMIPERQGRGQVVATEFLLVEEAAREYLREGALDQVQLYLRVGQRGSWSLDRSLREHLRAGRISFQDAFARADEKTQILELARTAAPARG